MNSIRELTVYSDKDTVNLPPSSLTDTTDIWTDQGGFVNIHPWRHNGMRIPLLVKGWMANKNR